jgi:hypothetical protein
MDWLGNNVKGKSSERKHEMNAVMITSLGEGSALLVWKRRSETLRSSTEGILFSIEGILIPDKQPDQSDIERDDGILKIRRQKERTYSSALMASSTALFLCGNSRAVDVIGKLD